MPGNIGINVSGSQLVRPSVATVVNTSALVPSAGVLADIAGVIGYADGGVPNVPMTFTSFAAAAAVLRGGPILSYLARIFNPSPDVSGANTVQVIRCGASLVTQAVAALAGLSFTTEDYGLHTNGDSIQVSANASFAVPAWDVVVRKRSDGIARTYTVGPALQVSSTATVPKLIFDHVNKVCTVQVSGATLASLAYPSDAVNVSTLASFLNTLPLWTAQVAAGADPSMPLRFMDNPVAAPTIGTALTSVPANQGMAIYEINLLDPLVTVALTAGSIYANLSSVAETYCAGGTGNSTATYSSPDYVAALAMMDTVDIQALFVCDVGAQALAYADVLACRTIVRKKYRVLFTGGPVGQTVSAAAGIPAIMAGPVCYAWNGVAGVNPVSGVVENLGGLGTAAQLCGLSCGSTPGQPITNKSLVSYGVEFSNPQDSDITTLLTAGVSPVIIDPSTGRTFVVQGLTTWQGGTNVAFRILQGLRVQDALTRLFNSVLNGFLGAPLDLMTGNLIVAAASKALDSVTVSPQNPGGYLTPGSVNGRAVPAWKDLQVTTDGLQSWSVTVGAHPVGETDYIQVLVNLTPVSISL